MDRKTGYYVWIYAKKTWHRTEEGADKQATKAQNYCHNVQIINIKTGELVSGRSE